jgi:hypothetical protein
MMILKMQIDSKKGNNGIRNLFEMQRQCNHSI